MTLLCRSWTAFNRGQTWQFLGISLEASWVNTSFHCAWKERAQFLEWFCELSSGPCPSLAVFSQACRPILSQRPKGTPEETGGPPSASSSYLHCPVNPHAPSPALPGLLHSGVTPSCLAWTLNVLNGAHTACSFLVGITGLCCQLLSIWKTWFYRYFIWFYGF